MKRMFLAVLTVIYILSCIPVYAEDTPRTIELTKDGETYVISEEDFPVPFEIPNLNDSDGEPYELNKEIVEKDGYAVYGDYTDVPGNDCKNGEWRYLGYDIYGQRFANFDFPWESDSHREDYERA